MHRRLVASSALAVLVASTALVGRLAEPDEASYSANGFSHAQAALIEWAIGGFADAGLELPPLEFVRHPTREPCRGARGLYTGDRSPATIRICTPEAGPFAEVLFLHEIAHAWDGYALTDRRRAAFLELRDLDEWWDDGSVQWHTYGAEQAAQIIVWGLIDRPIRIAQSPTAAASIFGPATSSSPGARPYTATPTCARRQHEPYRLPLARSSGPTDRPRRPATSTLVARPEHRSGACNRS